MEIENLPIGADGPYISSQMAVEDAAVAELLKRTRNSWYHDMNRDAWFLYPSVRTYYRKGAPDAGADAK